MRTQVSKERGEREGSDGGMFVWSVARSRGRRWRERRDEGLKVSVEGYQHLLSKLLEVGAERFITAGI